MRRIQPTRESSVPTPDRVVPDHAHSPLSSSDTWSHFVGALRTTLSATVYILENWLLFTSSGTTFSVDGPSLFLRAFRLKAHNRRCRSQEGRKRDSLPSACICTFSSIEPVSWVRLRPSQRGSNTTTATSSHLSPVQASFACRHFPDSSVVQVGLVIRSWAHSLPTW